MRSRFLLLLGFLAVLTGIRWFAAASFELSPDESYYYLWSQHPDICYYSKGPGVAMAILASTSLFGPTEFGIRFFSPLLGLGTSIFVYFLALKLFREKVAFWSVIALNLVPIFNVGSTVMTIDPLSVFFWAASLFTFWMAIERSPKFSFYWPVTGILIGLGFLCKYTNAFELFSILFFLLVVPKYRGELRRPGFYILLLCFSICLVPPLIWNQQHEWITLDHLAQRGGFQEEFGIRPDKFATFVAGQLGVYSPLLYIGCLIALFGSIRKAFQNSKICFLLSFAWPILLTYAILGFHQVGEPNWTAPGLISLGTLATAFWLRFASKYRWAGAVCLGGLILSGAITWITLNTDLLRVVGVPVAYRFDPSARLRGWQTIAERIGGLRAEMENKLKTKVFLIGNKYQTASMLSFYLPEKRVEGPGHPPVYIPESQDMQNEFSFWPRYDEFVEADPSTKQSTYFSEQEGVNKFIDRTALYITDRPESAPPHNLQGAFNRWELVAVYELQRRNLPLREIRVFACYEYQTLPL
jgi:4-amino-4-deoxy-L-arabinose transferase-like glycosyltransferase